MAYTPGGDTAFGIYESMANATARRVNWRVVSRPEDSDGGARVKAERMKICGSNDDGMPGVGREYGRQLGIVAYRPQAAAGRPSNAERWCRWTSATGFST